jgi:hypothetical protein
MLTIALNENIIIYYTEIGTHCEGERKKENKRMREIPRYKRGKSLGNRKHKCAG